MIERSADMRVSNMKETTTKEIATNIFLHTSKVKLTNTEDLAHTLYTYTVSYPTTSETIISFVIIIYLPILMMGLTLVCV